MGMLSSFLDHGSGKKSDAGPGEKSFFAGGLSVAQ